MKKQNMIQSLILKIEDLLIEAENNNIKFDGEEKFFLKISPYVKKNKLKNKKESKLMRPTFQEKLLRKELLI